MQARPPSASRRRQAVEDLAASLHSTVPFRGNRHMPVQASGINVKEYQEGAGRERGTLGSSLSCTAALPYAQGVQDSGARLIALRSFLQWTWCHHVGVRPLTEL